MSAKDRRMIVSANQSGISVWRVTKPSKNPAIIKNGTVLMTILSPAFMARTNDSNRV